MAVAGCTGASLPALRSVTPMPESTAAIRRTPLRSGGNWRHSSGPCAGLWRKLADRTEAETVPTVPSGSTCTREAQAQDLLSPKLNRIHLCRIPRTGFTRICSRAWRSSGPTRSGAARLPVSGGGHGLGEPTCLGLAAAEHPGRGLPCRDAGSPASPFRGECAPGRGRNSRDRAETSKEATRGDRSARRRMYETIRLRLRGHSPLRIPGGTPGWKSQGRWLPHQTGSSPR